MASNQKILSTFLVNMSALAISSVYFLHLATPFFLKSVWTSSLVDDPRLVKECKERMREILAPVVLSKNAEFGVKLWVNRVIK